MLLLTSYEIIDIFRGSGGRTCLLIRDIDTLTRWVCPSAEGKWVRHSPNTPFLLNLQSDPLDFS